MKKRIDLRPILNGNCETHCGKEVRQEKTEEDLCIQAYSVIDGLSVRCVGPWAYDKIYFLNRYFDLFAGGMKYHWPDKLAYFEICSGPGRCIDRKNGEEMDGTPLVILNSKNFDSIKKAYFIDNNHKVVEVLNQRIRNLNQFPKAEAILGDYTHGESLEVLIRKTNPNGLNLVFIDPTDCSVPFDTIEHIASVPHTDIILNVALWTDLNRNLADAIENPKFTKIRQKYESFLGETHFFTESESIRFANDRRSFDLRSAFMVRYKAKLHSLGYQFIASKEINGFYNLVFAAEHERAYDFWIKAAENIQPDGQRSLFS